MMGISCNCTLTLLEIQLRFAEECGSPEIRTAALDLIFAEFETSLASDSFRTVDLWQSDPCLI